MFPVLGEDAHSLGRGPTLCTQFAPAQREAPGTRQPPINGAEDVTSIVVITNGFYNVWVSARLGSKDV